jgi:hypothetical protein
MTENIGPNGGFHIEILPVDNDDDDDLWQILQRKVSTLKVIN